MSSNKQPDLVIATQNPKKLTELESIIGQAAKLYTIKSLIEEFGEPKDVIDWEEDQPDYKGNAFKKVEAIKNYVQCGRSSSIPTFGILADDSGLCVDALGGKPGVFSARYAGEDASDSENVKKLLSELQTTVNRKAHFSCCIAYWCPETDMTHYFEGKVEGEIITSARTAGGFGYDPVFVPHGFTQSFAEMSAAQKNKISHRSKALGAWKDFYFKV